MGGNGERKAEEAPVDNFIFCMSNPIYLWFALDGQIEKVPNKLTFKVKVAQWCPTRCDSMDLYIVHGILQARILQWIAIPFTSPNLGLEPRSPALQADSLLAEPRGKPKNTI